MTRIMGILNITPDSFYSNSRYPSVETAIKRAQDIYAEGADILDIGGESTRPGAPEVDPSIEMERIIPVIQAVHTLLPISVDTRKPTVAIAAIEAGATLLNDISGFSDPGMQEIAASSHVEICVMHMQGSPQTMQNNPFYPGGVVADLMHWFEKRIELLLKRGVSSKRIILDPGIGFGKTVEDNLQILRHLSQFKSLGFPLLLGISRKSFISKILEKNTENILYGTIGMNTLLIRAGIDIIRVHDVEAHRDVVRLLSKY